MNVNSIILTRSKVPYEVTSSEQDESEPHDVVRTSERQSQVQGQGLETITYLPTYRPYYMEPARTPPQRMNTAPFVLLRY